MESKDLVAQARTHLSPALYRSTQLVWDRGEGCYLITADGDRYLDFISGIAVTNLGHNHPEVVAAAKAQIDKLIHPCAATGYYESAIRLAAELAEVTPGDLDSIFFSNSGAEAVEGAIKLARYATRRPAIIAFKGAFHGRTMGATALTASSVRYRQHYEPVLPGVYHVSFPYPFRSPYKEAGAEPYLQEIRNLFSQMLSPQDVAAVIVEPVQGEGGYIVPPDGFLQGLRELTREHGILLIFDEVQTGFGRTGKMFAAEHFGVVPDIMVMAKGIANGFPLSAIAASRELMAKWPPGSHGSTYGGNPVACAAALATLRVIRRERLAERAAETGAYMRQRLEELQKQHPIIGDIRGLGLMVGIELVKPDGSPAAEAVHRIADLAFARKLLFYSAGVHKNVIRFMVPLNIARADLDKGLDIFAQCLAQVESELMAGQVAD